MDYKQVELIQNTFAKAAKIAPHLAATFYTELFAIAPTLRPMFKADRAGSWARARGAEFTPEARAAWAEAYQFLCDAMCEAAYGPPAARAP
jgi:hemoglobin-like flavoprotein